MPERLEHQRDMQTLFSWCLLQPGGIAYVIQTIWCAVILQILLRTRQKSYATKLLIRYFAVFTMAFLTFAIGNSLVRFDAWMYFLPIASWLLILSLLFMGQFAYYFPCATVEHQREAAVVFRGTLALLCLHLLLTIASFSVPSWRRPLIGGMFGLFTLGIVAIMSVFWRRLVFFSETDSAARGEFMAARPLLRRFWSALRHPSGKQAQATHRFLLTMLSGSLSGLWPAIYFIALSDVVPLYTFFLALHLLLCLLFLALILTYLNYTPDPHPFLAKFMLSTLFIVFLTIMFIGEATLYRAYLDYDEVRQSELPRIAALLEREPAKLTDDLFPDTLYFLASASQDEPPIYLIDFIRNGSTSTHVRPQDCVWFDSTGGVCLLLPTREVTHIQKITVNQRDYAVGFPLALLQRYLNVRMAPTLLAFFGSLLFIFLLFPLFFRVNLMTPMEELLQGVRQVQAGNLHVVTPIRYQDEIGFLSASFNTMVRSIEQAERQLQDYNRTLEQKVADRTQELSQTLADLKATQQELIQAEKMAALGKLVANIAHEINTPLGAIRASTMNIANALHETTRSLPPLLRALPAERYEQFCALLARAIQPKPALTSREERAHRRAVKRELDTAGIANADSIADTFVDMGIYDDMASVLTLLQSEQTTPILQTAYHIASQHHHSANILAAVERMSKIVFALKSYAQSDASGEATLARVTDGLDVVLTLYYNQLKHGIDVVKQYADTPPIRCYPDELNQVWTNLIHNAMQAMSGKGRLEITVKPTPPPSEEGKPTPPPSEEGTLSTPLLGGAGGGSGILVEITDSGCGIPPEIKPRIFEPFFTTKPAGEGSGFGLDICRKIIDKHQGKIEFDSQPGRTTFRVWLPQQ